MEPTLEQMARSLVESGDYRVTSRLEPQAEYHPPDSRPKPYSLGFFHDGHRAASDCRATLHALTQTFPGTGRLALQALLEQPRLTTWRLWARDAAIEKKDVLKAEAMLRAPENSGDRNPGIAMCRMPIRQQRCRDYKQM
jgi:hypothetical protein